MLKEIIIENYKSIEMATIELGQINVLLGANGSGKSNLLSLFELLKSLYDQRLGVYGLQRGGMNNLLYGGLKRSERIHAQFNFDDSNAFWVDLISDQQGRPIIETTGDFYNYRGVGRDYKAWSKQIWDIGMSESNIRNEKAWRADYIRRHLTSFTVYHFHDSSWTSPMRQACAVDDNRALRHDASNLAAFLYLLQERYPKEFASIEESLHAVAPYFKRFDLQPDPYDPKRIALSWEEQEADMYFGAAGFSDGMMRFVALATLLLQPHPPATIIIDEPELGLHPAAIVELGALLRIASHRSQLILSTQSELLLNQFTAEEVLVVERKGGGSTFKRLDAEALSAWLEDYTLGELWQKNLLGGRP